MIRSNMEKQTISVIKCSNKKITFNLKRKFALFGSVTSLVSITTMEIK